MKTYKFRLSIFIAVFILLLGKGLLAQTQKVLRLEANGLFSNKVLYSAKEGERVKIRDTNNIKHKDTLHILSDNLIAIGKDTLHLNEILSLIKMNRNRSVIGHSLAFVGAGIIVGGLFYVQSLMNSPYLLDYIFGILILPSVITTGTSTLLVGETLAGAFPKWLKDNRKFVIRTIEKSNINAVR